MKNGINQPFDFHFVVFLSHFPRFHFEIKVKLNFAAKTSLLFRVDYRLQLEIVFNTFALSLTIKSFLPLVFHLDLERIKVHRRKLCTRRKGLRRKKKKQHLENVSFDVFTKADEDRRRKCYRFQQSILNNERGFVAVEKEKALSLEETLESPLA
jgi:hypothetical protein